MIRAGNPKSCCLGAECGAGDTQRLVSSVMSRLWMKASRQSDHSIYHSEIYSGDRFLFVPCSGLLEPFGSQLT